MQVNDSYHGGAQIVVRSDDGARELWRAQHLSPRLEREIAQPEWLPPAGVLGDDVDDLRAELAERLAAARTAARNLDTIREQFAREDDAQIRLAADAIRAGTPAPDDRTSPEDRLAAIREHSEAADAAQLAWWQSADDAIGYVLEHVAEWDTVRAELERDAAERIAEAERRLAEARAVDQHAVSLERWLERNGTTEVTPGRTWASVANAQRREAGWTATEAGSVYVPAGEVRA